MTGTVTAANRYDAERILVGHNLIALDVVPEKKTGSPLLFWNKKFKLKDKLIFARQLATMISAGLPLVKAITIVSSQARNDYIKGIYQNIYKDLEEGESFSAALSKHSQAFDRVFVSVINSGETTGKLDVVLEQLARQLENDNNFIGKVKSIMYYPAFILLALIGVGTYMMVSVVPQLKSLFDQAGADLPMATKILLFLSDFIVNDWWIVLILIVVTGLLLRFFLISEVGTRTVSRVQLLLPGMKGLFEGVYISRFTRTMQMLIGAGIPLLDALKTASSMMKNELYEDGIAVVMNKVEKGVPLSRELLKNPVFPPLLGQMAAVGEETGQLDKVLGKVADYYEEETSTRIKTISSLIEPIVLLIIGAGVAFLVFAILLPIYNLTRLQ